MGLWASNKTLGSAVVERERSDTGQKLLCTWCKKQEVSAKIENFLSVLSLKPKVQNNIRKTSLTS